VAMAPKFIFTLGPKMSQNWLFIVLVVINVLLRVYKKYGAMAFHDEAYATLIYVTLVLRLFALTP
jgi:hypothetical protein